MVMNSQPAVGLDASIFTAVIEKGSADSRVQLAAELARLLADPGTPDTERQAVLPSAIRLATDAVADVRRTLVMGLSQARPLHADLLFTIIAGDDTLALAFLAATPALDEWRMVAVLRAGDKARQRAIALRGDIAPAVVDEIVGSRAMDICAALLENPAVNLSDDNYRTLFVRFGQAPEIVEQLIARPELPLDIRILQTKRASNRIHQLMAERGWVAANDAAELVADAEETAILHILVNADKEELARVVAFLTAKKLLLPSIILRAACLGEMRVVERALAHLADVAPARARQQMYGAGLAAFKSLHAKSGLPPACLGLLKAAADVAHEARDEGLRIGCEGFGRRLIEALMTRYEHLPPRERARALDYVGRFADSRVRMIARRLKTNMMQAA